MLLTCIIKIAEFCGRPKSTAGYFDIVETFVHLLYPTVVIFNFILWCCTEKSEGGLSDHMQRTIP